MPSGEVYRVRSDTFAHRVGPHVHRFIPRSLRGRLALAAVLCSLVAVWVTYGLVRYVADLEFERAVQQSAVGHLDAFDAFVVTQRDEMGAFATSLSESVAARGGPSALATRTAGLVRSMSIARASSAVVLDEQGRSAFASGTPADLSMLRAVASALGTRTADGLEWSGRVMVVGAHAVRMADRTVGYVVAARPLESEVGSRFLPLDDSLDITFGPPDPAILSYPDTPVGGFIGGSDTQVLDDGSSRTLAVLPSISETQAGVALFVVRDARLTAAMDRSVRAALATAIFVSLLGMGVGMVLARTVQRPIDRTRRHLRDEGARALEGLPVTPAGVRRETTTEFVELSREVDLLLEALSSRHNELVTARDHARKAEETLRIAVDGSPEMKLVAENGIIIFANPAAQTLTGTPIEDIVGKPSAQVIREWDVRLEDGTPLTIEAAFGMAGRPIPMRGTSRDGVERSIELMTVPMSEDRSRTLITIRDTTEERRLEAIREEIFSLVSHDLRAPLTVVRGYLDILQRPLQPEARERALESARHNADKMEALLEGLLEATAPEDLLAPKSIKPTPLCDIARDVVSSMQAAAHGHSIVAACDGEPLVLGEERRLRQALVNLVANAIKYAPEETTITVRVGQAGGLGILAVEDEGPGIPAENREEVFARYGRLASAEKKPGLGLGLYIVNVIADTHGGRARVEDAPGGGARFLLEIPLAPDET